MLSKPVGGAYAFRKHSTLAKYVWSIDAFVLCLYGSAQLGRLDRHSAAVQDRIAERLKASVEPRALRQHVHA